MSSTSSQGLAVSLSASNEPECEPLRSARSSRTRAPSLQSDGPTSPATTMCEVLLRRASGQMELFPKSSAAASLARTSALRAKASASKESEAACGPNTPGSLAKFDPVSSSWKMLQPFSGAASTESLVTWPRSGTMRSGIVSQLPILAHRMTGTAYGLLPTPSGVNGGRNHTVGRLDEWGGSSNPFRGTDLGKMRCASFEEWMMGLPIGFTELTPSETPSSRKSRKP